MKAQGLLLCLISMLTIPMFGQTNDPKPDNFATIKGMIPPNLLMNPGAEDSLEFWTQTQGVSAAVVAFDCNGIEPNSGERYFAVGGLCEFSDVAGILSQDIDVSAYADSIAQGNFMAYFGGYLSNWNGDDIPEMRLHFLDGADGILATSATLTSTQNSWTLLEGIETIPMGTAVIRVELEGTQVAGSFNDSYFDDLFMIVGSEDVISVPEIRSENTLSVYPNPVRSIGTIAIQYSNMGSIQLTMTDLAGSLVECDAEYFSDRIEIRNSGELQGLYLFTITSDDELIGKGKVVF